MKKLSLFLISILNLYFLSSCEKEKLNPNSVLEEIEVTQNNLDKYIERTFVDPYNVAIVYKYEHTESDLNYNLSPPDMESAIRMTRLLWYLGLQPYDEVTGSPAFIRKYFPKLLNYIGSPAYNNNGTIVLGTAEGGRKITLYNLNELAGDNASDIEYLNYWYFHTIHHEFGHILNQTKPYSSSFREITGSGYVNDAWNDLYDDEGAIDDGFISAYAAKAADEDFVELYSFYITLSEQEWNDRLSVGSTAGRAIIETKLNIVKDYLNTSWDIDMDELRAVIQDRQARLDDFDQLDID